MSVKPIIPSIEDNKAQTNSIKVNPQNVVRYAKSMPAQQDSVSFTGAGGINPIVGLMDFIEQGGYAASFIIQDGIGFIAPRVGKGLLRGSLKTDENGQPVLDENGKQKRELNWQLARKEFLREIITGPSAFLIPLAIFTGIKKWGNAGNNVKLNYINGFESPFAKFAKENAEALAKGKELDKAQFYKNVYSEVIESSINAKLPEAERIPAEKVSQTAEEMANKLLKAEEIMADTSIKGKKAKRAEIAKLGESVEDMFMRLKKSHIGGTVNELAVEIKDTKGNLKGGSISELGRALNDYFTDAVKNVRKAVGENATIENFEKEIQNFTKRRMGSRILTNLGIFGTVALFYAQIPKLYNMGQNGNPALKGTAINNTKTKDGTKKDAPGQNVAFTGGIGKMLEVAGEKTFSHSKLKKVSDIFEFDGNIMSGAAMPVLLYGFCIPPRLRKAEDKYDYGEIVFRDMTSFTALLFGAKALARLFSDGFTKITGLALNKKDLENRNIFQKVVDYLNPLDKRHSVLSSKQLASKYTNIDQYKNGALGFVQFVEESGGNIKKAFSHDKSIKAAVEDILKKFTGVKSYNDATVTDIKDALKAAQKDADQTLIKKFYGLFNKDNKILSKAKTCNSTFGFVSTIVLIPSLIMWIANKCEKMTKKRAEQDMAAVETERSQQAARHLARRGQMAGQIPTMAGFLGHGVR